MVKDKMALKKQEELEKMQNRKVGNEKYKSERERVSLVERIDGIIKQKKDKVKDIRLGILKVEENKAKDCTFKPKINKRSHSKKRSVNDLFEWQKDCQRRKMQKEMDKANKERKKVPRVLKKSKRMVERNKTKVEDRLLYKAKLKEEKLQKLKDEQCKGMFKPTKYTKKQTRRVSRKTRKKTNPEDIAHDLCKKEYEEQSLEKFRKERHDLDVEVRMKAKNRKKSRKRAVFEYDQKTGMRVPVFTERENVAGGVDFERGIPKKRSKRVKGKKKGRGKEKIQKLEKDVRGEEAEFVRREMRDKGPEVPELGYNEDDYNAFREGLESDRNDKSLKVTEIKMRVSQEHFDKKSKSPKRRSNKKKGKIFTKENRQTEFEDLESEDEEEIIVEPIIVEVDDLSDESPEPPRQNFNPALPPKLTPKHQKHSTQKNFKNSHIQEKILIPQNWSSNHHSTTKGRSPSESRSRSNSNFLKSANGSINRSSFTRNSGSFDNQPILSQFEDIQKKFLEGAKADPIRSHKPRRQKKRRNTEKKIRELSPIEQEFGEPINVIVINDDERGSSEEIGQTLTRVHTASTKVPSSYKKHRNHYSPLDRQRRFSRGKERESSRSSSHKDRLTRLSRKLIYSDKQKTPKSPKIKEFEAIETEITYLTTYRDNGTERSERDKLEVPKEDRVSRFNDSLRKVSREVKENNQKKMNKKIEMLFKRDKLGANDRVHRKKRKSRKREVSRKKTDFSGRRSSRGGEFYEGRYESRDKQISDDLKNGVGHLYYREIDYLAN